MGLPALPMASSAERTPFSKPPSRVLSPRVLACRPTTRHRASTLWFVQG